jgi:hypothetical protein
METAKATFGKMCFIICSRHISLYLTNTEHTANSKCVLAIPTKSAVNGIFGIQFVSCACVPVRPSLQWLNKEHQYSTRFNWSFVVTLGLCVSALKQLTSLSSVT